MNLHNLNSEGTEGNQQQTRMVHVIDDKGRRAMVNAISGDMFKHILAEHLMPLLKSEEQELSSGALVGDPDRINRDFADVVQGVDAKNMTPAQKLWIKTAQDKFKSADESEEQGEDDEEEDEGEEEGAGEQKPKKTKLKPQPPYSALTSAILGRCAATDILGALITNKKPGLALQRKSVVEFGWVVGVPQDGDGNPITTTEQYFHVKYAPEGRGASAGGETVAGTQAIFHRPASSGIYALICNLDLYRIGFNDITREYVVAEENRNKRSRATIHALAATLVKPTGAQRNTQSPHIVACEGVIATSRSSLPAPTVSPLASDYKDEVGNLKTALNKIQDGAIEVTTFHSLADAADRLREVADEFK